MVILRIFDDCIGDDLLVAEDGLVVVVRGKVTVHHLCMVSHSNLYNKYLLMHGVVIEHL